MAKKITGYVKLQVPAGAANPSPPIGPALGQRGLNIMEFCKAFNAQTQKLEKGTPIPVTITVYADRSFSFETANAADVAFPQEGGRPAKRLEGARPRCGRLGHQGAGARDRRAEDEGSELRYHRGGHAHGRRLRPIYGAGGEVMTALGKRTTKIREGH